MEGYHFVSGGLNVEVLEESLEHFVLSESASFFTDCSEVAVVLAESALMVEPVVIVFVRANWVVTNELSGSVCVGLQQRAHETVLSTDINNNQGLTAGDT